MKVWFLGLTLAATGCQSSLDLDGSWLDQYGSTHTITDDEWQVDWPATFHVVEFDNGQGSLIAHNDPSNDYNPGEYSQFDWVLDGDTAWYCQIVYDAATAADAADVDPADATDPASGGCGVGPWTSMEPAE